MCWYRGALSSSRPPCKAVRSSVQDGEPAKLCQDEPATTSSARSISTSDADKPPQKCGKGIAVWRLSSFLLRKLRTLRDFAYGENLCVSDRNFLRPKVKRLQLSMPQTPQGLLSSLLPSSVSEGLYSWPVRLDIKSAGLYNSLRPSSHNLNGNENRP